MAINAVLSGRKFQLNHDTDHCGKGKGKGKGGGDKGGGGDEGGPGGGGYGGGGSVVPDSILVMVIQDGVISFSAIYFANPY